MLPQNLSGLRLEDVVSVKHDFLLVNGTRAM